MDTSGLHLLHEEEDSGLGPRALQMQLKAAEILYDGP